jgi:hypothetical protein
MEDPLNLLGCFEGLEQLAARLIDGSTGGPDGGREADLALKLFGTMMGAYLSHLLADPDHPTFLPSVGYHQMYGSPNPDTVYRTAMIDGHGEYLITGYRGSAPDVSVMPFGPPTAQGLQTFPLFDLADLTFAHDGKFEVVLSRNRPRGAANWWALDPEMRTLMLRSTSHLWGTHVDPRLAIVRLDANPRRQRLDAEVMLSRLRSYAVVVEAMLMSGIRRVADLRANDVVNRLEPVDYSANGGLKGQWYFEGCFALTDEEALLVEVLVPPGCTAFSLSLTDPLFSTLDWANSHSSLNHHQASIDPDGRLRVAVAAEDPQVRNWLDTTGHTTGVLQFRWFGGTEEPHHDVAVVSAASLQDLVPTTTSWVSSVERAEIVRARQIGVQLRSLW